MPAPLLILGLDAGDADLIQAWAESGALPNIAALMARGSWARVTGPELLVEHGVWVTLTSGQARSQHNYYNLREQVPGAYDLRLRDGRDVEALPFWAGLRGAGRRAAVIDVPDSRPVPGLSGLQLVDWAAHNMTRPPAAEPRALLARVRRLFGPRLAIDEVVDGSPAVDRRLYRQLLQRVARKGALCRQLLTDGQFDLVFIVFGETHTGAHQFWRYRPEAGEAAAPDLTETVREIYRAADREIGALLAQAGPDANVVVLTSVGIREQYPTDGLAVDLLRQLGYQRAPAGGGPLRPIDRLRQAVPEAWRVALSRRFPRAARERLLADQFRAGSDWARTTAFAIPSVYTSLIRVNLAGREPCGPVQPGAEYENVLARLEADFTQLIDPLTGRPAVSRVIRTEQVLGGGVPAVLPDLFIQWQAARHFLPEARHPRARLRQARPEFFRGTDHSDSGFIAAAGPAFAARGEQGSVNPLDLAPTFLRLLDLPQPALMSGQPLHTWLRA